MSICPECTMDVTPNVRTVLHCPVCGDIRMPPEPKAIARIYGRQVRAEYDATMRDLAASERHEPDTVAEEQIAELRRERDRYREALQAIYDHDDGAWAAGEYAEEARRVGISTVRGIAARALAPVAP